MLTVPESDLKVMLEKIISATSGKTEVRHTAVRWFNRLYYSVRTWNESFIQLLKSYPGFEKNAPPAEYAQFLKSSYEYRDSLEERHGSVKNDLCTDLKILAARFTKDFKWLYDEDRSNYEGLRGMIDQSYATEMNIILVAHSVVDFIYQLSSDPDWHIHHHQEVVDGSTSMKQPPRERFSNCMIQPRRLAFLC